ncbi:MAG: hypothetical protein LC624_01765 [Halobacteriales archaeon]|nr:hypothetical protein [Halobacteriales archaeon]
MDLFIFRCTACQHVAPEYAWTKRKGAQGMGRGSIVAFPKPVCPSCGSEKVDLNHDLRDALPDEEERVTMWRKPT